MAVLPGQTARSVLSHRLAGPTTAALADRTTGAGLNPSGVKQWGKGARRFMGRHDH